MLDEMKELYDIVDKGIHTISDQSKGIQYNPDTTGLPPVEKAAVDKALTDYNKPSPLKGAGGLFTIGFGALADMVNYGTKVEDYKSKMDSLKDFFKSSAPKLDVSNISGAIKNKNAFKLINASLGTDNANQNEYIGSTLMARPIRDVDTQFGNTQNIPQEVFDKVQVPAFRAKMFEAMVFSQKLYEDERSYTRDFIDRIIAQAGINAGGEIK